MQRNFSISLHFVLILMFLIYKRSILQCSEGFMIASLKHSPIRLFEQSIIRVIEQSSFRAFEKSRNRASEKKSPLNQYSSSPDNRGSQCSSKTPCQSYALSSPLPCAWACHKEDMLGRLPPLLSFELSPLVPWSNSL